MKKSIFYVMLLCSIAGAKTFTDDFNRANEDTLQSPWVSNSAWNAGVMRLSSNIAVSYGDNVGVSLYDTTTTGNNQFSKCKYVGGSYVRLMVRYSKTAKTGYSFGWDTWAGALTIEKHIAGTITTGASYTTTLSANDSLRITASNDTIRGYKNGSLVATYVDSEVASGYVGIGGYPSPQSQLDDWSGGDIGSSCNPPTITGIVRIDTVGVKDTFQMTIGGGTCDSVVGASLPAWMTLDKTGANMGRVIVDPTTRQAKTGYLFTAYGCSNATAYDSITVKYGDVRIDSVSPSTCYPGGTISAYGRGYGDNAGTVLINGLSATVSNWTNTKFDIGVPDGADTGKYDLQLTVIDTVFSDTSTDTLNSAFTVLESVSSANDSISFIAPSGYSGNVIYIVEDTTYHTFDTIAWSYDTIPNLSSISRNYGKLSGGDSVNLYGSQMTGVDTVWIGANKATIVTKYNDSVKLVTPLSPATGSFGVRTFAEYGYKDTLYAAFLYKNIILTSVSRGKAGDTVTIRGYYGLKPATTCPTVKVGDTTSTVVSCTDTTALVILPGYIGGDHKILVTNSAGDTCSISFRYASAGEGSGSVVIDRKIKTKVGVRAKIGYYREEELYEFQESFESR